MPSLSSFALAFPTRSDCLFAHSGLRFPSSTYFMATSTACWSFCVRDHTIIHLLATRAYGSGMRSCATDCLEGTTARRGHPSDAHEPTLRRHRAGREGASATAPVSRAGGGP